ncbi:MAG TPA: FAD-dependent oxidoreductase [Pseudonocardiaceae bacterium]|nr:FAD-dependent oxidoreductase [Pseudonocardiaceae bacterium]
MSESALVIGAGVSGLTSAVCLVEAGFAVRIWAADPPRRTTSLVAGALWGPSFQQPMAKTLAWTETSLRDFRALAEDSATGVRMVPSLTVGELPPGDPPPQALLIPELRPCPPAELPAGYPAGFRATMPLVDMPRYLDYLTERLAGAGVEIEQRTVRTLDEATAQAPLVVNCAGLGARELLGDASVRPIRGQHVIMSNPGLDQVFLELTEAPEWINIFPHPSRVVCGGNAVPDSTDTTVDDELTERIVRRCRAIEPRLHDAEVIEVLVGLRPDRPVIRVEAHRAGDARVVHNYGHGGSGVSLSWGAAREVVALAG